ncbi:MAG TPA: hypothetical protein VGB37_08210, partial [Candidatus Lokiarchaeia archaeon]
MKKKNIKFLGIALILLFTYSIVNEIFNVSEIPAIEFKKSDKDANNEKKNEEIVDEEIFKEDLPKTSNSYESNLNFSFDTQIIEIANESWSYVNYNVTGGGFGPSIMIQEGYNGSNSWFEFYITGLINASSPTKDVLSPNDLSDMMYMNYKGKPEPSWVNYPIIDDGPGKGNCSGYLQLNDTVGFGASALSYTYDDITNITFNATLYLINAFSNK